MKKAQIKELLLMILVSLSSYAQNRVTDGLQVLYKFNEGSGSTITDV
ncbi:MAG: hypothetical protein HYS24_09945, partial [Ignavibacteriales bacterium]|nr:hypothetical protein [Ignavibacteriales bacterium]